MALRGTLTHWKTRSLAEVLGLDPPQALGILEALWHVTAEDAPGGNIGRLSNQAIALQMFSRIDPDRLIAALIQSGHLDEHPVHRLLVHDWHVHADSNTKRKVARRHESMYAMGADVKPMTGDDASSTANGYNVTPMTSHDGSSTANDRPPVPEPVPEPEPGPVSPPPSRSPVAMQSAGANGEFLAATELMQQLRLPSTAGDIRIMAQVIALQSPDHGGVEKTTAWLKERATAAELSGEIVDMFWFKDKKFNQVKKEGARSAKPDPLAGMKFANEVYR